LQLLKKNGCPVKKITINMVLRKEGSAYDLTTVEVASEQMLIIEDKYIIMASLLCSMRYLLKAKEAI
jgi:hypothetical protein